MSDPNIDKLYNMIRDKNLAPENLIEFTAHLMQLAQKLISGKNKGEYKKQLVLQVAHKYVSELESSSEKDQLLALVDNILPASIDTIVAIATGKINLGKLWETVISMLFQIRNVKE